MARRKRPKLLRNLQPTCLMGTLLVPLCRVRHRPRQCSSCLHPLVACRATCMFILVRCCPIQLARFVTSTTAPYAGPRQCRPTRVVPVVQFLVSSPEWTLKTRIWNLLSTLPIPRVSWSAFTTCLPPRPYNLGPFL